MSPQTKRRSPIAREQLAFNHLLQFKQVDQTATRGGTTWINVANSAVRGNIRTASVQEVYSANQSQQELSHVVTIWNPAQALFTPTGAMQIWASITFGAPADSAITRKFNIIGIKEPDFESKTLEIHCLERGRQQ